MEATCAVDWGPRQAPCDCASALCFRSLRRAQKGESSATSALGSELARSRRDYAFPTDGCVVDDPSARQYSDRRTYCPGLRAKHDGSAFRDVHLSIAESVSR